MENKEFINDFIQYAKELGEDIKVVKSDNPDTFEKIFGENFCNGVESIRQELLERGDEMVSFRQLVERFDEVEEEYKGVPWNLEQIYNNFNILIGEKPCEDVISRQAAVACFHGRDLWDDDKWDICEDIKYLPSVQPKETNTHELLNKIRTEILNEKVPVARCDIYDAGDQGLAEGYNTAIENVLEIIDEHYLKEGV